MSSPPKPTNPDTVIRGNISITIGFAFLAAVSAISLAFFHANTGKDDAIFREKIAFCATAASTALAATSAFYLLRSVQLNSEIQRDSKKIDRTLLFIQRWNEPSFAPSRTIIAQMVDEISGESEANKPNKMQAIITSNPEKKQAVTIILNFLEEMSICLDKGFLDEDLIYDFYRSIVPRICQLFSVFITERRNIMQSRGVFKGLTDLNERWSQRNGIH